MSMAHCANCHQTYGSVKSFYRHRTGGQCITDPTTLGLFWRPDRNAWSEAYSTRPHHTTVTMTGPAIDALATTPDPTHGT